ncbi:MAG: TetR family transcriptional regulator [Pseudomonadales bacterium]|nr:TetR family transcriptional regulator [Pseudomonadales bacterium]
MAPKLASHNDQIEGRRELILRSTLRVIAEEGVGAVTHRRVAKVANVPLGSTIYYFDSRLHLLREAFDYYLALSTAAYETVNRSLIVNNINDLVDFVVTLNERQYAGAPLLLAEYELTLFAARDPEIAKSLHRWDELAVTHMARHLKALNLAEPQSAARDVIHLIRGYELERLSYHKPDTEKLRKSLTRILTTLTSPEANTESQK